MTLVVVAPATDLAFALGARTDAVPVAPDELEGWLAGDPRADAVVVDVGSEQHEITRVVDAIRSRGLDCPVVVVAAPEAVEPEILRTHQPLGIVARPFTVERLLDRLGRLGRPVDTPVPAAPEPPTPRSTEDGTASDDRPPSGHRRRFPRRHAEPVPAASAPTAVDEALSLLAATDDLASVPVVAEAVAERLAATTEDVIAVMVLDDAGWRVAAGIGLRPLETRSVLPREHWLSQRLEAQQSSVIVSGTDLVRQDLRGVPLIAREQWMATTLEGAPAIVVRGRDGATPYTIEDALSSRRVVAPLGGALQRALALRTVARRLAAFQDQPE